MAKANSKAHKALLTHDYLGSENMDTNSRGNKNPLSSPCKATTSHKKQKGEEETDSNVSNSALLAAIEGLQKMMESFGADLKQNTLSISNIAKAVEFNSAEIQDCKEKNKQMEKQITQLKTTNEVLTKKVDNFENKASNLDRYQRKWNLRLKGLKEDKEEDTRQSVSDIIKKIQPSWKEKVDFILDSVHRIGPKNPDHPRQVIIQFTSRFYRDELWRSTKQHPTCRELNIRFAEDLTKEDREARLAVWPRVEQARKAGLKTTFKGPYAFINGQRVTP
uniref:L1 transposable element RRM domain-containing protein n=1 Tax=Nothobranchius rachovii TaxID=451742 RepID=A0A1A8SD26_9TELE